MCLQRELVPIDLDLLEFYFLRFRICACSCVSQRGLKYFAVNAAWFSSDCNSGFRNPRMFVVVPLYVGRLKLGVDSNVVRCVSLIIWLAFSA